MTKYDELVLLIREFFLVSGVLWSVIAMLLLWVAWRAARRGNIRIHKRIMIIVTAGAWIFIEIYIMSHRYPQLAVEVPTEFIPWIILHGSIGVLPVVGATMLLLARWRNANPSEWLGHFNTHHRTYGRVLIGLWVFTHIGGIGNGILFFPK